ncbi:MAG: hypothetical protein ACREKE_09895 [bacterium]
MSFHRWMALIERGCFVGSALVLAAALASAQPTASPNQSSSAAFSSSSDSSSLQLAEISAPASMAALPSAPSPAASAAGQQYGGGGGVMHHVLSNYALEFGGGFNAPAGDKQYITWGGQFTLGAGEHFGNYLSMLMEYQFIDDKLPGAIIAETGAQGGHVHIWSLTLDPVFDLFPKSSNDVYITGGGGFYRKVTIFTDVEPEEFCSYYYCGVGYAPQTVGHFSSNQGGYNIGAGYQHRMGGMYGPSKMAFFAEARYLDVLSPAVTSQPNSLGTTTVGAGTTLVPITVGLRW